MSLIELLQSYVAYDQAEAAMVMQLRRFLESLENPQDAFERELAGTTPDWGHVTGSAWVINEDATQTLLVHHAKLGRWVQPGGHCDGESDVLQVALREVREETGIEAEPVEQGIFDVDVHVIPEYWYTPEHYHYDVRFLMRASSTREPVKSIESYAVRWVSLEEAIELNSSISIARMVTKTRTLLS